MEHHIYIRVGRYHDASVANELALQYDQSYISECRAQGKGNAAVAKEKEFPRAWADVQLTYSRF
jgi:hypothetical protein